MKKALIGIIKIYQKTISPDHGIFSGRKQKVCRFHPTCSQYMVEAIEKHGILRGIKMGSWRIVRCNPWNKGGFDPVEPSSKNLLKDKGEIPSCVEG